MEKLKTKAVAEACGRFDEYFGKRVKQCQSMAISQGWDLKTERCSRCRDREPKILSANTET
jgi:hypothetical protein